MKNNLSIVAEELGLMEFDEDEMPQEVTLGPIDPNEEVDLRSLQEVNQQRLLDRIDVREETAIGLESMQRALKAEDPKAISKLTLRMANAAIGVSLQRARIDMQEMPFSIGGKSQDAQAVVETGLANVGVQKEQVFAAIRQDMARLLVENAKQKAALGLRVKALWAKWHMLEQALSSNVSADKPVNPIYVGDNKALQNIMYSGKVIAGGASVISDLTHFLTEHSHLFKRLVKKQTDWVNDHKDNVLKCADGFSSYSFNPTDYRCNNSFAVPAERLTQGAELAMMTHELPGAATFITYSARETKYGQDAIEALAQSRCEMGQFNPVLSTQIQGGLAQTSAPLLSEEELKARMAEIQRGITAYQHWIETGFVHIWKEAYFEEAVLASMVQLDAQGIDERIMGSLASATLRQLTCATLDVGTYAYNVIDGLLTYVQLNVRN